ncbi:hypothetical protein DM01DRAFT_1385912 [Hesseltinella vesiculosa]|uniref:Uncharacterized protein n=1 Tax=Hesseltinella vesiculosa TaxID=101127 RepID=A0A1X2G7K3_9FUNG|nr:hypothetical protein DM01DRAFT_1385912 [Hesseltinella vesiculosa]
MLYEHTKRDVFCQETQLIHGDVGTQPGHDGAVPSVTTIVLLQVQASMIQVISRLHQSKEHIPQMVQVPLRWGLLLGLVVVDNVARAMHVDQEMVTVRGNMEDQSTVYTSDDQQEDDTPPTFSSLYQRGASAITAPAHSLQHTPRVSTSASVLPTRRSSSMTSAPMHQDLVIPQRSQSTSFLSSYSPSSPLLAVQPPLVSQSSQGLRVRLRKTSSPPNLQRPIIYASGQSPVPSVRARAVSNQLFHSSASPTLKRQSSTVRRVTARRNLTDEPCQ